MMGKGILSNGLSIVVAFDTYVNPGLPLSHTPPFPQWRPAAGRVEVAQVMDPWVPTPTMKHGKRDGFLYCMGG
jgi:hypothetical protein